MSTNNHYQNDNIKNRKSQPTRVRIAPSPTGYMHIGTLRTALYTYLIAKQNNGKFLLRIEDTDLKRYVPGAIETIYNALQWAGLNHDEGPNIGGPYGPYIQSQRLDLYKKYANELLEKKLAYYCFCDEEALDKMRKEQVATKQAPRYDRRCLKLSPEEIKEKLNAGIPRAVRMKIPENRVIKFNDLVRGEISYNTNELDDQVILKSDGYPTYHLAVVVDDHLMEISHVTRTEEWLPSTPKHILLYEYLEWVAPQWAHLPLLLNEDRTKMSKRKGDVAIEEYINEGYLPEAMINFLAFLGWNPGTDKEIYSIEELIKDFSMEKVHKAGAVFNLEKLNWFNSYYLRQKSAKELVALCIPFLEKANLIEKTQGSKFKIKNSGEEIGIDWIEQIVRLEQERMKKLSEIGELTEFFFRDELTYDTEILRWKNMSNQETKDSLDKLHNILSNTKGENFTANKLAAILMPEAEKIGDRGRLLWPLRVSITGLRASPGPFEVLAALGKEKALKRIREALARL